jgi:hypothetical protein
LIGWLLTDLYILLPDATSLHHGASHRSRKRQSPQRDVEARLKKNQCTFIRGFKISIREKLLSKLKGPVKLSFTDRNQPEKLFGPRNVPSTNQLSTFLSRVSTETHSQNSPQDLDDSQTPPSTCTTPDEDDSDVYTFLQRSNVRTITILNNVPSPSFISVAISPF